MAYALQPGQSGLAQGDVTLVLSYTQPGGDLCVASIRCSGGSVCGCHKKASTCADGVDVDHVRTTDGQWWKLQDTVRAEVRPGGEVAFYSRGSGRRLFEPADGLSTRWGKVSECGKDFGH